MLNGVSLGKLLVVMIAMLIGGCTSIYSHSYYEPRSSISIPVTEYVTSQRSSNDLITPVKSKSFHLDYNDVQYEVLAYATMKEDLIMVGPVIPIFPLGLFDLLFFPGTDDKTMTVNIYLPEENALDQLPAKIEMIDLEEGKEIFALAEKASPGASGWADAHLIYLFGDQYPDRFSLSFIADIYATGPLDKPTIVFERRYRPALKFSLWY